jgi:ATP-dependent Clp protease protease subunit
MREEDGVLDSLKDSNEILDEKMIEKLKRVSTKKDGLSSNTNAAYSNLLSNIANKDLWNKVGDPLRHRRLSSEKALGQRKLRKEYSSKAALQMDSQSSEFRDYYRKQTERTLLDEESKKVFMIINSFGGSVGNGITVHDALQFIKAGSLTLALGVAASAASLALAGGTIGERYVTEGCHVMIHQPEGGLSGQASDIWIDSQEIMKIRLDVAEIYSLSTYRPRHKILRDLDRDFYLSATETIHYGLADEIASNEIMHEIIEMTSKVWDYHDTKQQRLLESRDSMSSGVDTQTQN